MITPEALQALIQTTFPNASVEAFDKTGMLDHYIVLVRDASFVGQSPLARHRAVLASVDEALKDGRLHAIEIKTQVPETVG